MKERYLRVRTLLTDNGYKMEPKEKMKRQLMMGVAFVIVMLVVAFCTDLGFNLPNSKLRWGIICTVTVCTLVFLILSFVFRKLSKWFNLLSRLTYLLIFVLLSLYWSSFWQNYFLVFVIFVLSNIILCLFSIGYNIAIIDKLENEAWEYQNHMLFLPTSIFLLLASIIILLVKLFNLSGYFVVVAVEMLMIGISQLNMYPYLLIVEKDV